MYRPGMYPATFAGGISGRWAVESTVAMVGNTLPAVAGLRYTRRSRCRRRVRG